MFLFKESLKKKPTFFKKTFLSFLTLTLIITLLLTCFLSANYLKSAVSLIHKFNDNLLQQSNYSITYLNDVVEKLSIALTNDKDVIGFLNMKNRDSTNPIVASKAIDKHLLTLSYINSVYLYNAQLDLYFSSKTGEQAFSPDFYDQEIVQLLKDPQFTSSYSSEPIYRNIYSLPKTAQTCSYIIFEREKQYSGSPNAIIINIDTELLTESIRSINQFGTGIDMSFIVADPSGILLSTYFGHSFDNTQEILLAIQKEIQSYAQLSKRFLSVANKHYLLSSNNNNPNNWLIIGIVPIETIFRDIFYTTIISLVIVIFIFLLCSYLGFKFTKKLNAPLRSITQLVSNQNLESPPLGNVETHEFQLLASTFTSLRERSTQLDQLKKDTAYSLKQDCLNHLVSGSSIHTQERTLRKLDRLNLSYLAHDLLYMCLFRIDHYEQFLLENNQKERSALRFAISNISLETATKYFTCETSSKDSDKLLLIVQYDETINESIFSTQLEQVLKEIQYNVQHYLNLSLSVAYSNLFKGLEYLPTVYQSLCDAILMRMNQGHQCIISPSMLIALNNDNFELPLSEEELLIQKILSGQALEALDVYQDIATQLFQYNYNEVLHFLIHLMYNVYSATVTKYPPLKADTMALLKEFIFSLQNAEVSQDVNELMTSCLTTLCHKITDYITTSKLQNSTMITQKICTIIETEYSDPSLCLNSIAEQLGLSPNYIGHLFKSNQNQSIAQYLFELRMSKLDYYMKCSNLSLTTIIEKVGLEKNNYFYTRFKKHFGMSLGEYKLKVAEHKKSDTAL